MSSTTDLTIAQAAKLIAARKLSPVELAHAHLCRIQTFDPQINAFITVTSELALKQARDAEAQIAAGRYRGSMHGIPFGLKDVFNTAGILTSAHSKICIDNIPDNDATAVARLYEEGAVLLGKLATFEFAHGGPASDLPWPPARNPWHGEPMTGGSSSGPAAALAAGFVLGALGTDTGGSIRGPASLCGIVGLKPTYGLVSRHGVIPSSFTFDTCGPMALTVEDCAILLQTVAGYDAKDPTSANRSVPDYRAALNGDIRGLRVGVIRHFWEEDLSAHEDVRNAMEAALEVFSGLGAKLEVARMRPLQEYYDVKNTIALPELISVHHRDLCERAGDYCADTRGRGTLAACLLQGLDYIEAQRERGRMLAEAAALFEKYDILVTVGSLAPAPRSHVYRTLDYWRRPNVTTPFSVTGGPALVLCNGYSAGLPLGMQIVGRPFDEPTVLKAGHAYEQATSWHRRKPELVQGKLASPVTISSVETGASTLDEHTREFVAMMAQRAGLRLTEPQLVELFRAAPYALAMTQRSAKCHDRSEEPTNLFRFWD